MSGFQPAPWPRRLQSQERFEGTTKDNIYHRSWMNQGLPPCSTLAVVREGYMIELDVPARRLHLDVPEAELAARLEAWWPAVSQPERVFAQLHHDHVGGADTGAVFDFLRDGRGDALGRDPR